MFINMLMGYVASLVGFFMGSILLAFLFIEVVVRKRKEFFYLPLALFFFGGGISSLGQSLVYQFTMLNNMPLTLLGEKIQHLGLFILFPSWIHFIYRYFFSVKINLLISLNYLLSFIFIPLLFFTELLFTPQPFIFKNFFSFASGSLYTPVMAYCFINIFLGAVLIVINFLIKKDHKLQNLFFSIGATVAALTGMKDIVETWYQTPLPQIYTYGIMLAAISHFIIIVSRLSELDKQASLQHEMEQEMKFARNIQSTFIAPSFHEINSFFQVSAVNMPGMHLGGDLYHVSKVGKDNFLFVVGDIAGKGVSASLYMSFLLSFFKTLPHGINYTMLPAIAQKANTTMLRYSKDGMFATCFMALIDVKKKKLSFINAGHQHPIFLSSRAKLKPTVLNAPGMPFGIDAKAEFTCKTIPLNSSDFLFVHTDGLEDSWNRKKKMFDLTQVEAIIRKYAKESTETVINQVLDLRKQFKHSKYLEDDITLLLVKIL